MFNLTKESKVKFIPSIEKDIEKRFSKPARRGKDLIFEFSNDKVLIKQYLEIYKLSYNNLINQNKEDESQKLSRYFIAKYGNQTVAGAKITIRNPRNNFPLPMELNGINLQENYPNLNLKHNSYCEISNFARVEGYGGEEFIGRFYDALLQRLSSSDNIFAFILTSYKLEFLLSKVKIMSTKILVNNDFYDNPKLRLFYVALQ